MAHPQPIEQDRDRAYSKTPPKNWLRGFIQGKTRAVIAWIFSVLLALSAKETPFWGGVLLCGSGAALRVWASGYLRKDSRLVIGGPYAWVRNPLYLGTYLMATGAALAVRNLWLFGAASIIYFALYHYIILDEEVKLRAHFGRPFDLWCGRVGRFFPRLVPFRSPEDYRQARAEFLEINPEPTHRHYSWSLAMKNKAYEALAAFGGLIGAIWLVAWLRAIYFQV